MAQQLARSAPGRVGRLVLAATGPGLGGVPGSPRVLLNLATPRRYRDRGHYVRTAGRTYGGAARRDPVALLHAGSEHAGPPSTWGYLGQLYAIAGWTSLPWLHRIPHPTLVMAGDDDPIVPLVNARVMAKLIPNARLSVYPDGHLGLVVRARELAAEIAGFLSEP